MNALYSVAEILAATGGQGRNIAASTVSSISIDSREIDAGALFVAIKGDRFDGHDYVRQAIEGGAAAALVSESKTDGLGDLPLIVVPDAMAGLVALAKAARARCEARIIAVTGSAGKTTTKEALRAVLSVVGKTHASIKSFNNHWGVPLMLARMPHDTEFGVFEIGMSAPGEISPLSKLVRPDIAVITAIAPAHMENFDNLAGIARAKAEIFDGLEPHGWAIVNADHDEIDVLRDAAAAAEVGKVMTYGFGAGADVHISNVRNAALGLRADISSGEFNAEISIASAGKHRMANAVATFLAATVAGAAQDTILKVLAELQEPEGRGAVLRFGGFNNPLTVIDESYNANPASMAAALDVLGEIDTDALRKVVVLGDMLELGEASAELHRSLAENILALGTKRIFLVGTQMAALAETLGDGRIAMHGHNADEIMAQLLNSLDYGDVVMVKGSNGMQLAKVVTQIRDRFGAAHSPIQGTN